MEKITIKLKLGRLVESPIIVNNQGRAQYAGYQFSNALAKLGEDPMPVGERYAAGRVLDQVKRLTEDFDKRRNQLVTKHGKKASVILTEANERLAKEIEQAKAAGQAQLAAILTKNVEANLGELAKITANPAMDLPTVMADDQEATAAFEAELAALRDEDITIDYLDHLIPLHKDSSLTGSEMMAIKELITVKAE